MSAFIWWIQLILWGGHSPIAHRPFCRLPSWRFLRAFKWTIRQIRWKCGRLHWNYCYCFQCNYYIAFLRCSLPVSCCFTCVNHCPLWSYPHSQMLQLASKRDLCCQNGFFWPRVIIWFRAVSALWDHPRCPVVSVQSALNWSLDHLIEMSTFQSDF